MNFSDITDMVLKAKIDKTHISNKVRHEKTTGNWRDVLINSLRLGETRPCRVRTLLTKHLNRAKVVVVPASLVRHVYTMVVEVELVSVTGRL